MLSRPPRAGLGQSHRAHLGLRNATEGGGSKPTLVGSSHVAWWCTMWLWLLLLFCCGGRGGGWDTSSNLSAPTMSDCTLACDISSIIGSVLTYASNMALALSWNANKLLQVRSPIFGKSEPREIYIWVVHAKCVVQNVHQKRLVSQWDWLSAQNVDTILGSTDGTYRTENTTTDQHIFRVLFTTFNPTLKNFYEGKVSSNKDLFYFNWAPSICFAQYSR